MPRHSALEPQEAPGGGHRPKVALLDGQRHGCSEKEGGQSRLLDLHLGENRGGEERLDHRSHVADSAIRDLAADYCNEGNGANAGRNLQETHDHKGVSENDVDRSQEVGVQRVDEVWARTGPLSRRDPPTQLVEVRRIEIEVIRPHRRIQRQEVPEPKTECDQQHDRNAPALLTHPLA